MNELGGFLLGVLCAWALLSGSRHGGGCSVRPRPPGKRPSGPAPQPPGPALSSSAPVLIPRGQWFEEPERWHERRN